MTGPLLNLAPTTELEAVNALLMAVGETPINSIDSLGFTDAAIARATLHTKAREILSRGWYFNRDYAYTFVPAIDGRGALPANVLSIRPASTDTRRLVPRDGRLWNSTDATYVFAPDNPPTVEVVWMFDFETLPETARRYITVRTATQFRAQYQGSDQSYTFTKDAETFAFRALLEEEALYEPRANMFNDAQDVAEIFTR